jgi:hypothetical protein
MELDLVSGEPLYSWLALQDRQISLNESEVYVKTVRGPEGWDWW